MYGPGRELSDGEALVVGMILGPVSLALLVGLIYRWARGKPPLLQGRDASANGSRAFLAIWLGGVFLMAVSSVGESLGYLTARQASRLVFWPVMALMAFVFVTIFVQWLRRGAPVRDYCARCGERLDFRLALNARCPRCGAMQDWGGAGGPW